MKRRLFPELDLQHIDNQVIIFLEGQRWVTIS
jgi:hypothetical protein